MLQTSNVVHPLFNIKTAYMRCLHDKKRSIYHNKTSLTSFLKETEHIIFHMRLIEGYI